MVLGGQGSGKAGAQHQPSPLPHPGPEAAPLRWKGSALVPASWRWTRAHAPSLQDLLHHSRVVRGRRAGAGSSQGARKAAAGAPGPCTDTAHPSALRAEGWPLLGASSRRGSLPSLGMRWCGELPVRRGGHPGPPPRDLGTCPQAEPRTWVPPSGCGYPERLSRGTGP